MNDMDGNPLANGDPCVVVGGTHKGGRVEDLHRSKTGAETITVRQTDGERFKTLARNVRRTGL